MAAHAAQPNGPTAHCYSAVTTARSSRPKAASLLAAPRRRSAARCLVACFGAAAAFRLTAIGVGALAAFAVCLCRTVFVFIAAAAAVVSLVPAFASARSRPIPPLPARFVTSACRGSRGGIWLATEGHGVWHYNPKTSSAWQNFSIGTAANHNASYAITCDTRGRIWVGSLNEGVFVCLPNPGEGRRIRWRRYGLLTDPLTRELAGPIGEHVYSIGVDPIDGSVWICTNSGISRYEPGQRHLRGRWVYYDLANGLPSDDVQCVAFGRHGRAYVATTCCGIAISKPTSVSLIANKKHSGRGALHYGRWRVVASRFTEGPPLAPMGRGLPSNLINAIITTPGGEIWVATDEGLAWSADHGRRWSFLRGAAWQTKDRQLIHPPAMALIAKYSLLVGRRPLLAADHINCIADDGNGLVWIGFWRNGVEVLDPRTGAVSAPPWRLALAKGAPSRRDVSAITPLDGGGLAVTYYGGLPRIWRLHGVGARKGSSRFRPGKARLPAPAASPSRRQVAAARAAFARLVGAAVRHHGTAGAVAMDQDWLTEGNWMGRYGTYTAVLCAMDAPSSLVVINGWVLRSGPLTMVGSHFRGFNATRSWVQWLFTSKRRVLEMPRGYLLTQWLSGLVKTRRLDRREAEYDDHGEALPDSWQGPGLYIPTIVPRGLYVISYYEFNYNGESGPMRQRDYTVTLRRQPKSVPYGNIGGFNHWPDPVRQRVVNFWGGVWIRFLVRGPGTYTLKLGRNYSLNTIVQAECMDLAVRRPPPFYAPLTRRALAYAEHQSLATPPRHRHPTLGSDDIRLGHGMIETLRHAPARVMARRRFGAAFFALKLRYDWAHRPKGVDQLAAWRERVGRLCWLLHRYRRSEMCLRRGGFTDARKIERSLWHYSSVFGFVAVPTYCGVNEIYARDRSAALKIAGEKARRRSQ